MLPLLLASLLLPTAYVLSSASRPGLRCETGQTASTVTMQVNLPAEAVLLMDKLKNEPESIQFAETMAVRGPSRALPSA